MLSDVVVHEAQLGSPDLVYVSDADPAASARTRKDVLGRFTRRDGGFRWREAKEDGPPVE